MFRDDSCWVLPTGAFSGWGQQFPSMQMLYVYTPSELTNSLIISCQALLVFFPTLRQERPTLSDNIMWKGVRSKQTPPVHHPTQPTKQRTSPTNGKHLARHSINHGAHQPVTCAASRNCGVSSGRVRHLILGPSSCLFNKFDCSLSALQRTSVL